MTNSLTDSSHALPLKKRSNLRIAIGKKVLRSFRYLNWMMHNSKYSLKSSKDNLKYTLFEHSSTLIRPLKGLDLQLQYNKITNLSLAINKINNIVLPPKHTFSFWYLVGKPTKGRGFKKGMILQSGKVMADHGGGMCQLSNLIYWMVIHSPLYVTERHRHSYDVFPDLNRNLPFGSGATIAYNYIDLQFLNDTDNLYQFKFWLTDNKLYGQILTDVEPQFTYKIIEEDHKIVKESLGGYSRHNKIYREVLKDGEIVKKELIAENHALMMYSPLLENEGGPDR